MIYDCFLYNGEADQLAIRMGELADLGPVHVAVQGTHTFQGTPRDPVFPAGVRNVVVESLPGDVDPWDREEYQRNSIIAAIPDVQPNDWVIVSDADEIPRASVVEDLTRDRRGPLADPGEIVQMRHVMYYFALDLRCTWGHDFAPVITSGAMLRTVGAHKARWNPTTLYDRGGWHFSYLGGVNAVLAKMASYSHTEFRRLSRTQIERCIQAGVDYDGRGELVPVSIDELPECVRLQPERWRHLMKEAIGWVGTPSA